MRDTRYEVSETRRAARAVLSDARNLDRSNPRGRSALRLSWAEAAFNRCLFRVLLLPFSGANVVQGDNIRSIQLKSTRLNEALALLSNSSSRSWIQISRFVFKFPSRVFRCKSLPLNNNNEPELELDFSASSSNKCQCAAIKTQVKRPLVSAQLDLGPLASVCMTQQEFKLLL